MVRDTHLPIFHSSRNDAIATDTSYLEHVPYGHGLMIVAEGKVEKDAVNRMFIVAGTTYGVSTTTSNDPWLIRNIERDSTSLPRERFRPEYAPMGEGAVANGRTDGNGTRPIISSRGEWIVHNQYGRHLPSAQGIRRHHRPRHPYAEKSQEDSEEEHRAEL